MSARILVIDDNSSLRDGVTEVLTRKGYEVLSTNSPLRVLENVRHSAPIDLVLSDVYMPEIQGTQLIHKIGQISPQTSFVLMTGDPFMSASFGDNVPVLTKPFSPTDLISIVHTTLAWRSDWV